MKGLLFSALFALVLGTSIAVPSCPPDNDILMGNPADCTTFYQCLSGTAYLQNCPAGLHWAASLNRCEFPETAQCEETEELPTTISSTTSTEGPSTTQGPRPDKCPEEDGPEDVLLPNPDDCGSFFKCLNGIPNLIPCPPGQEWSIELNRCDLPSIAHCSQQEPSPSTSSTDGPSTTQGPRPDQCPEEDGPEDVLLPNPDDCGSFFKCLNGIPNLILCPPGQEWSIELNRCDLPSIAHCTQKPSSTTSSTDGPSTTQGPRPDKCPEEDGPEDVLLPNPDDCGSFFKCLNGIPNLILCPPGQEWSIELNRCDLPSIAHCTQKPSSTTSSTDGPSTTQGPRPDKCPEEDGPEDVLLPNPDDCGSFFKCLNGIPNLIPCPPGQEWSIELNRCDLPSIAHCSQQEPSPTSSTEGPSTSQGPRPDSCPEEDGPEDVLLPNPEDCGSFFKCLNGIPNLIPCPPGQEWSIELNRCDLPSIAHCTQQEPSPTSSASTIENSPIIQGPRSNSCPEEDGPEDVLLPNPDDCESYFKCWSGIPILIPCPPEQEWSIELNRCDLPSIANCTQQGNVESIISQHPGKNENSCPAEDGPQDVLLPNPADCGSFYKCSEGIPVLQQCPTGLHWNDNQQYCDYPENAQCVETETSVATQSTASRLPSTPFGDLSDHCPDEDGPEHVLLLNPNDCKSFFKCLGGIPHLIPCPSGLHWNQKLQYCDHPAQAQCEEGIAREVSFFRNESSEEDVCPPHNSGYDILFANPEDCSTYYQCSNGEKILMHCPEGTLWYASAYRCDHEYLAVCYGDE